MRTFILLIFLINSSISSQSRSAVWTFANSNGSVSGAATVPGGIYSDLQRAGVIGDILSGFNDVSTRWVAHDDWIYLAKFNVSSEGLLARVKHLVFEGIDTVAFVELNDQPIGTAENMFLRYVYDVGEQLQAGENTLKVTFISPIEAARVGSVKHFAPPKCVPSEYNGECNVNQLRKMQASFSWDWGPAFPSVGIWKPVVLELYNGAIIRSVTTRIEKQDTKWKLKVRAHLETSNRATKLDGFLSISLQLEGNQALKMWKPFNLITRGDGTIEVDIDATVNQDTVRLWWPNGYGEQPLYDLHVNLTTNDNKNEASHKHIKIGFRTLELVETNASKILGNTTAGTGLTFYFKVNGYNIFMKGSNWIPANILPELGEKQKDIVDNLLMAARNVHMAMLRVWGGGIYESDYFYQKCDELGILIWQDFMFACSMYPVDSGFLNSVKEEIEQNVIRLQHHPSIAVWAGNNENEAALVGNWYDTATDFSKYKEEYISLYVNTIKPIVESLDPGRRYLVSSPSNGLQSETDGYVAKNPYDPHFGDTHYYNYFADNWDMNIYPKTRFASEYGFQSLPSIATMKTATVDPHDFSVQSNFSKHRQHSPNGYSYIETQMLKRLKLEASDPKYFEKFVFYSQISQAMAMKAETEYYRQSQSDWYTMGALYWQLNDVWQAPSWSGIESNGKWKILHYFAKSFFAPVLVSPRLLLGDFVEVYLLNDRFVPIVDGQIKVEVFKWNSLAPITTKTYPVYAEPLSSVKQSITFDFWVNNNKDEVFLKFSLQASGVKHSPANHVFPKPFKSIRGLKTPQIQVNVSNTVKRERNSKKLQYTIEIQVDTVVLFLWLETSHEGHFKENAFIITEAHTQTQFVSNKYISPAELQKSIQLQYYVN